MHIGIDIGSTTVKVVLREKDKIIYSNYRRHFSTVLIRIQIQKTALCLFLKMKRSMRISEQALKKANA